MDKYSSNKKNSQHPIRKVTRYKNETKDIKNKTGGHQFTPYTYEKKLLNNRKRVKKIFIASLGALFIGLTFGLIMLNMIRGDQSIAEQTPVNIEKSTITEEQEAEDGQITVPSLSAYTVQLGVFSKESNAKEYVEQLNLSTDELMIWSKDSSFYVFSRLTESSEQIETMLKTIQKDIPDSFKKAWQTDEFNLTTNENIEQWLDNFVETWNYTLNNMDEIKIEQWEQLLDEQFSDDALAHIQQSIRQLLEINSDDFPKLQQKLLNIWYQFEVLLFTLDKN